AAIALVQFGIAAADRGDRDQLFKLIQHFWQLGLHQGNSRVLIGWQARLAFYTGSELPRIIH
ncbi:MAG: hypothetical protein V3U60_16850, partial [Gammaproteobacteria bacterium]